MLILRRPVGQGIQIGDTYVGLRHLVLDGGTITNGTTLSDPHAAIDVLAPNAPKQPMQLSLGGTASIAAGVSVALLNMEWTQEAGLCATFGVTAPPDIHIERTGRRLDKRKVTV